MTPASSITPAHSSICKTAGTTSASSTISPVPAHPQTARTCILYMNTNLDGSGNPLSNAVDAVNIVNGPLTSNSSSSATNKITLTRLANATGTATMYFDNIITADQNVNPGDPDLP